MADQDPNRDPQDRNVEEPGDTDAGDIVGRTGEQMPTQSHDGLESEERQRSSRVADDIQDPTGDDQRHAHSRDGRASESKP